MSIKNTIKNAIKTIFQRKHHYSVVVMYDEQEPVLITTIYAKSAAKAEQKLKTVLCANNILYNSYMAFVVEQID